MNALNLNYFKISSFFSKAFIQPLSRSWYASRFSEQNDFIMLRNLSSSLHNETERKKYTYTDPNHVFNLRRWIFFHVCMKLLLLLLFFWLLLDLKTVWSDASLVEEKKIVQSMRYFHMIEVQRYRTRSNIWYTYNVNVG